MWLAGLPVALVPLWQEAHAPVTPAWLNATLVHVLVLWQLSQPAVVAMWLVGLPVALVPLWQDAHAPVTAAWSKRTFVQFVVT